MTSPSMYGAREQAADRRNHSPEAERYRCDHGAGVTPEFPQINKAELWLATFRRQIGRAHV